MNVLRLDDFGHFCLGRIVFDRVGLCVARLGKCVPAEQARSIAQAVELDAADLAKLPIELSGGMKRRPAIAKALVSTPDPGDDGLRCLLFAVFIGARASITARDAIHDLQ